MPTNYEARWISRKRFEQVRKTTVGGGALFLDHLYGILAIEPAGSNLGDGEVLSPQEIEYEMQPVWLLGSPTVVREARRRVGLAAEQKVTVGV
jgi:hypothetical protein